jgi:hypothetical protein
MKLDADDKLTLQLYGKWDDINFSIVNIPFLSRNIPSPPVYGVYISLLIRCAKGVIGIQSDFNST